MEMVAATLLISGRVQGVWYRGSAQNAAQALGLTGWVRNLPTGQVEAFTEGPREKIESLIAWCRRGPQLAEVESVEVTWTQPRHLSDFRVIR
jgi:acylphosphatase